MNKQCIVIFPIYTSLKDYERKAFENAIEMTQGFDKVFIAPQSFKFDESYSVVLQSIKIIRFADAFFDGIQGYNNLMLSKEFYERFSDYEYMLIHQGDAFIFKPELAYWCNKKYDYIGAPWYKKNKRKVDIDRSWKIKNFPFLYSADKKEERREWLLIDEVGNGGFSLRKIETFKIVLAKVSPSVISKYLENNNHVYNEDVFWAVEASKYKRNYKKPKFEEALSFSIEMDPSACFELLGKELPFGCHAFNRFGTDFWRQFIPFL